jgi:enamine deaminase RidA (YjgF/YER057c/UK114 family)
VFTAVGPVLGEIFGDIRPTKAAVVVQFPVPNVKVEISATAVIGCAE